MTPASGASEEAWRLLERAKNEDLTTRESGVSTTGGSVVHALDPGRHRHLLLPVTPEHVDIEDSRSRGVSVTMRILQGAEEKERRYIDVECREVPLNDLFSTVCDEILVCVANTPDAAGLCVTTILERWRELLGPASQRLLNEQALKGLLAELHVLEALAAVSPSLAMKIWTGVQRRRHDFTGVHAACEVKASSLTEEVKIHINGLRQLSAPPSGSLYLAVERFERVPDGGDSITQAITRIERLGVASLQLLSQLSELGVQPADLTVYRQVQFRSLERRLYLVDHSFPRLTPELLQGKSAADRISSVEYVLNLGAQPPVPLPSKAFDELPGWLFEGSKDLL
ncbi:PD-(D/E)XK motif protein [Mycobacterium sp. Marseille-P9652]|uniref:PD-(D/E)XK motif protein n=1 Tax=Mycobacterium sp. Marseille-P9652 TaxID=2654950 RepID=UPI0012E7A08D|nr:PD-(D/E)XK motif protein [Mycobacterium sp. Marseille-P9652]